MRITIPNNEVQELLAGAIYEYPKYSTQILNLANQNAQGTRPAIVGQMSELIEQFEGNELEEWRVWYLSGFPDAIDNATERVWKMFLALKSTMDSIDKNLVKRWVEDLVIVKTFTGLKFQNAILRKISTFLEVSFRSSDASEESQGIDGYINDKPVSIKPVTYKLKALNETISVPIIFYDKRKADIQVEFDPADFQNSL